MEAAWLCAAAEGGRIFVTDLARLMVGRHATHTFLPLGAVTLKGLPEPVDVVEVRWEPAATAGSVPLPDRLVGVAADALFGFVGRRSELLAFDESRKAARARRRCEAVFVSGEPGIGKSALAARVEQTGRGRRRADVVRPVAAARLLGAARGWSIVADIGTSGGRSGCEHRALRSPRSALARYIGARTNR